MLESRLRDLENSLERRVETAIGSIEERLRHMESNVAYMWNVVADLQLRDTHHTIQLNQALAALTSATGGPGGLAAQVASPGVQPPAATNPTQQLGSPPPPGDADQSNSLPAARPSPTAVPSPQASQSPRTSSEGSWEH
jgi:hypothetical protein